MRIEELKLIPPSKRSSAVLIEFIKEHNKGLKAIKTLAEIKEIAWVNPVNTCWESLNLCDKCEEKEDCELQSPFAKLKLILEKLNEVEDEQKS